MLTIDQQSEIKGIVVNSLNYVEGVWEKHGKKLAMDEQMMKGMVRADSQQTAVSRIPGYPLVALNHDKVDRFIALVADIRNSSQHLLCAISTKTASVSELKRVYYETSALLPALEKTIEYEGGAVTEYLGDGILSLFPVDEASSEDAIRSAYQAARNCIAGTLEIVNSELSDRYGLPPLQIGIGLGLSQAIVSLVGLDQRRHPKAIGRCIYNATKLSDGVNEIYADEAMEREWPQSKEGKLRFGSLVRNGVKGFLVSRG